MVVAESLKRPCWQLIPGGAAKKPHGLTELLLLHALADHYFT